ncbi:hypothetical protein COCON_G00142020 [Conger conger]|uniref:Uncharacterized protein n=1 Tax=Conger conger TaxID=82655 RepID=A0A9Q1DAY8_CONCO|nr:hypothetical protein COCON_G00142020 [Conger conger]
MTSLKVDPPPLQPLYHPVPSEAPSEGHTAHHPPLSDHQTPPPGPLSHLYLPRDCVLLFPRTANTDTPSGAQSQGLY